MRRFDGGADVEVPLWIKPSTCAGPLSRIVLSNLWSIRDDYDGYNHCWQTTADQQVADHEAGTTCPSTIGGPICES